MTRPGPFSPMHTSSPSLRTLLLLIGLSLPGALLAATPLDSAAAALKAGDLAAAESALAPYATAEKPEASALNLLSQLRLAQKQSKEAVAFAERATAADPTQAAYFSQLGYAYSVRIGEVSFMQQAMMSGKLRKAYEQCVKLDPNSLDGLIGLTRYFSSAPEIAGGSPVKAREYAERVQSLNPFLGAVELGRLAEKAAQPAEALGHYEAACTANPSHAGAQAACGRMLVKLNRPEEARRRFEAALALNPTHEAARKGLEGLNSAAAAPTPPR